MEQIQITYQPVQDRLLMAIKEKDQLFNVWLTRRFVILLLAQLHQVVKNDPVVRAQADGKNRQEIMAFQKEQARAQRQISSNQPALNRDKNEPAPLLATGIAVEQQRFQIQCLEKKVLTVQVNTSLAYALINLIEQVLKKTSWGFIGVKEVGAKPKSELETDKPPKSLN